VLAVVEVREDEDGVVDSLTLPTLPTTVPRVHESGLKRLLNAESSRSGEIRQLAIRT
jgi:hypothetical protein